MRAAPCSADVGPDRGAEAPGEVAARALIKASARLRHSALPNCGPSPSVTRCARSKRPSSRGAMRTAIELATRSWRACSRARRGSSVRPKLRATPPPSRSSWVSTGGSTSLSARWCARPARGNDGRGAGARSRPSFAAQARILRASTLTLVDAVLAFARCLPSRRNQPRHPHRRRRAEPARDAGHPCFAARGFEVVAQPGYRLAVEAIRQSPTPFSVVLTDLVMPDGSGLDVLTAAKERSAATEVIVMTAHSTVETAVDAMRRGAYDFVTKPFSNAEIAALRQQGAREARHRRREPAAPRQGAATSRSARCSARAQPRRIIGADSCARRRPRARRCSSPARAAPARSCVARALHDAERARAASLSRRQLRRASRGAHGERALRSRERRVHRRASAAARASSARPTAARVLLDEVGELPAVAPGEAPARAAGAQGAPGGRQRRRSPSTCACSRRPTAMSRPRFAPGKFRQDLYYRLNVIRIEVPPLRERREDIADARRALRARASRTSSARRCAGSKPTRFARSRRYAFPGNMRELENMIERAVALASSAGDWPRRSPRRGERPLGEPGAAARRSSRPRGASSTRCSARSSGGSCSRRSSAPAAAAKRRRSCSAITFRSLRYRLDKHAIDLAGDDESTTSRLLDWSVGWSARAPM